MIKATVDFREPDKNKKAKVHSVKSLHCIECNRDLVEVLSIAEDEKLEETKYQFVCPCGGESFVFTTTLICKFLYAEYLTIADVKLCKNKIVHILKEYHA